MSNPIDFSVLIDGEKFSVSMDVARMICPIEADAVELAWKELRENFDQDKYLEISKNIYNAEQNLLHKLVIQLRKEKE